MWFGFHVLVPAKKCNNITLILWTEPMATPRKSLAFREHDHSHCIDNALQTAKDVCAEHGVKLTQLREQVLQLVWQSHKPLGAYAILELLSENPTRHAKRQAPPTVYRALEFLQEHGLVHRINSLNAFIGCTQPHAYHNSHFLICRECTIAIEMSDGNIGAAIDQAATAARFSDHSASVEILGLCPNCQGASR
jgi:Fur family transcriptional regulator, zinc uptake regulator